MYNNDYSYNILSNVYTYALYYRCNVHGDDGVFISPKTSATHAKHFPLNSARIKKTNPPI